MNNKKFILIIIGLLSAFGIVQGFIFAATKAIVKQQVDQIVANELKLKELKVDRLIIGNRGLGVLGGGGQDLSYCFGRAGAATSSLTYLGPDTADGRNATTTIIGYNDTLCDIHRAGKLDFNLVFNSSTSPTLAWEYQFSHDGGTWFNENNSALNSNNVTVTHGATTTHSYVHTGSSTINLNFTVTNTSAKYLRVNLKTYGGGGGYFWGNISRNELNN